MEKVMIIVIVSFLFQFYEQRRVHLDLDEATKCNFTSIKNKLTAVCSSKNIRNIQAGLPNDLKSLKVERTYARYLYAGSFQKLRDLKTLDLSGNEIKYVTSKSLIGLENLEELSLESNFIRVFTATVFKNIPNLKKLNLAANFLRNFKYISKQISILSNLEELNLDNNKLIEFILTKELEPLKKINLKVLKLRYCLLMTVEQMAFFSVSHSLKELHIDGNYMMPMKALANITVFVRNSSLDLFSMASCKLQKLPTEVIRNLNNTNLKSMKLNFNPFDDSVNEKEVLPWLPKLVSLEMIKCNLITFTVHGSRLFPNMKHLYLQFNTLLSIPKSISGMEKLEVLSIQRQIISFEANMRIYDYTFKKLKKLKILYINNNAMMKVTKKTFVGLVALEILDLTSCAIRYIEDNSFSELGKLEKLFLSENKFQLMDSTFNGLKNLQTLTLLGSLRLKKQSTNPFRSMLKLKLLDLSHNGLTNYDLEMLLPMKNLTLLKLDYNKIKKWEVRMKLFSQNKNLSYLMISHNSINAVTKSMIADFINIKMVKLSPNPFDCGLCETKSFQDWLKKIASQKNIIKLLETNTSKVSCSKPANFAGRELINLDLSLSHCVDIENNIMILTSTGTISFIIGIFFTWAIYHFWWYLRYWMFRIHSKVMKYKDQNDNREYKYDAFISYSNDDLEWVKNLLVPQLESPTGNFKLCLHHRDFIVGHVISDNIFNAIEESRKTIIVLSNNYLISRWCMFELHMAQHKLFDDSRDSLIIIELEKPDKSLMDSNIKYLCKTRTYIEWPIDEAGKKLFWERLHHTIAKPLNELKLKHVT